MSLFDTSVDINAQKRTGASCMATIVQVDTTDTFLYTYFASNILYTYLTKLDGG